MTQVPKTMDALVLDAPGAPLALRQVPCPAPGPGEVLVRLAASPINPSDLAMLRGEYGLNWPYPLIPGLEGAGQVVATGPGAMARRLRNRRVALVADRQGLWADYACVPHTRLLPLPQGLSFAAGASSFVNPFTALALVAEIRRAGLGSAVSTAAGGALGAMIRRRAREVGVKIINIVRSPAQAEALRAEGARYVLDMSQPGFDEDLAALCRDLRCKMAFDAVGGAMTARLAQALRPGGEIVVYGGLAGEALSAHPGALIFKGLTIRGFWLSSWLARQSLPRLLLLSRSVQRGLADPAGFAQTKRARTVPLPEAAQAPVAYEAAMSAGKTLITTGAYPID